MDQSNPDGNTPDHYDQHENNQNAQTVPNHPSMSPQETSWWAMTFDDLYRHAKLQGFGKGHDGRKSGRLRIIKWLCEHEGITPYVAPLTTPASTPAITRPNLRSTGAISHPEAILRTHDPALQRQIELEKKVYLQQKLPDLLELAMSRSYQLLKDSQGKLPAKSKAALANWLAGWDVLKSEREKRWWVGDGIELVNKAKAMGYKGSSRKYDVIVWLRATGEEAETEVKEVKEPTPNKKPEKKRRVGAVERVT